MKSILKKTIVITLLLVLALSLGLMAVGCEEKDPFFVKSYVNLSGRNFTYTSPRFIFPIDIISEEYFEGITDKEVFTYIVEKGHYDALIAMWHNTLVGSYNNDMYNHIFDSVANIGEKEITYFGGRKELKEGEILVHKWTYYQMLFETYGVEINTSALGSNTIEIFNDKNTLPNFIAMYATNEKLLKAYPLVIDRYELYFNEIDIEKGKEEYFEVDAIVNRVDGSVDSRTLEVVGFYTTGEEDYLLDTEFDRRDFSMPDYESRNGDGEIVEIYKEASITELEQELYDQYKKMTVCVYYG